MKRLILTTCLFVLFASCTALADWNEGDPYKMHFPQLPDPCGWDVAFSTRIPQLADDWQCSESGEVDDVHIWYSWEDDLVGTIDMVQLGIWSNDPDGGGAAAAGYSTPDELVWGYQDLYPGEFTTRLWGKADQGWYDPFTGNHKTNDHIQIFQLNIDEITDPFLQEKDEIYWLSVCFYVSGDPNAGWKTADVDNYPGEYAGEHFMDDAVWYDGANWNELHDPLTGDSLDLAFVITPEPATLSLLGLGSLVLLRKRRA